MATDARLSPETAPGTVDRPEVDVREQPGEKPTVREFLASGARGGLTTKEMFPS